MLLVGCTENAKSSCTSNSLGGNIKLVFEDENEYEYSIGLNERKSIFISTLKLYYQELLFDNNLDFTNTDSLEKITVLDADNQIIEDYISVQFGDPEEKVLWFQMPLLFKCKKQFSNSISIGEIIFEFESKNRIEFKTNIIFNYNNAYVNYPKFNPSYELDNEYYMASFKENPWHYFNCYEKYCFFDTTKSYNPNSNSVTLNEITFSENLLNYLKSSLKVTYLNANEDFRSVSLVKLKDGSYKYQNASFPYDMNVIANQNLPIVFKTELIDSGNLDHYVGGDIIYNVTINGNTYDIVDMFIIGPNLY